jgi:hypothetical protein
MICSRASWSKRTCPTPTRYSNGDWVASTRASPHDRRALSKAVQQVYLDTLRRTYSAGSGPYAVADGVRRFLRGGEGYSVAIRERPLDKTAGEEVAHA